MLPHSMGESKTFGIRVGVMRLDAERSWNTNMYPYQYTKGGVGIIGAARP